LREASGRCLFHGRTSLQGAEREGLNSALQLWRLAASLLKEDTVYEVKSDARCTLKNERSCNLWGGVTH